MAESPNASALQSAGNAALRESFRRVLKSFKRVAIAGGPKTGKTTLASLVNDRRVFLAQEFEGFEWSETPHRMIIALSPLSEYVVESVMVPRALRKGLKVDAVVYLHEPRVARTNRQDGMAKGILKVFKEWRGNWPSVPVFMID